MKFRNLRKKFVALKNAWYQADYSFEANYDR